LKLPFGIGKARSKPTPRGELVDDPAHLGVVEPGDAEAIGSSTGAGDRVSQLGRLVRLGGGPRPWTVWRIAAVAILIYVAAANLSYFLVLKPVWTRLDGLKERKTIIEDFFVVRESSTAVAAFRDGLMKGDQRMTVIGSIEDLASEAGVKITEEPKLLPECEISKRMVEYPLEFTLRGSYHEIGEFVSLVESSPRFLIIRRLSFEAPNDRHDGPEAKIVVGAVSWED
jgi:Tfp pilus assembly protein PilO